MPGDIALAGFVLTAAEWAALDDAARSTLRDVVEDGVVEYELYEVSTETATPRP